MGWSLKTIKTIGLARLQRQSEVRQENRRRIYQLGRHFWTQSRKETKGFIDGFRIECALEREGYFIGFINRVSRRGIEGE